MADLATALKGMQQGETWRCGSWPDPRDGVVVSGGKDFMKVRAGEPPMGRHVMTLKDIAARDWARRVFTGEEAFNFVQNHVVPGGSTLVEVVATALSWIDSRVSELEGKKVMKAGKKRGKKKTIAHNK